jgi:nicotinamidase-related amidase
MNTDKNNILVIVDMQNDFIDGSLGTEEAKSIIPQAVKKIEEHKKKNGTIIVTKDTHQTNYLYTQEGRKLPVEHCIYNTKGWELNKKIADVLDDGAFIVMKNTFGANYLANVIRSFNVKEQDLNIEVIGLCTDICVISNVILLKTAFPEASITVDSSCCAGVTPELHEAALKVMHSCQINIK